MLCWVTALPVRSEDVPLIQLPLELQDLRKGPGVVLLDGRTQDPAIAVEQDQGRDHAADPYSDNFFLHGACVDQTRTGHLAGVLPPLVPDPPRPTRSAGN